MTRLKPPGPGYTYNGQKVSGDGVEVNDQDADALRAAGWIDAEPDLASGEDED